MCHPLPRPPPYDQNHYQSSCSSGCVSQECLNRCGDVFKNRCLEPYECKSLEYTRLYLNAFPASVRCQVARRNREALKHCCVGHKPCAVRHRRDLCGCNNFNIN